MSHFKRDMSMMLTGLALGAVLTGGAVAAGVMAEPSWQNIYVDGKQVQMTAYNIAGNNYVKLRDIGKEVGFNVYWSDGVQVDSTAPYTGEAPARVQTVAEAIRVSSYKGNTLKAGDRSGLIISPGGSNCTVTSSNPAVISVERAAGNWVAVAKTAGTATITVSNGTGGTGSLTLTVEGATSDPSTPVSSNIDLNANMEVRQEMVRLINQTRRENGVPELEVNEALMNAAQDCAAHQFRNHSLYEWQALRDYGWPYGGGFNLTWFATTGDQYTAKTAVDNWINSPGHFQTMLRDTATCVGAGVILSGNTAYCYMVVGDPTGHSPL